jgi:integrase/recombinase XerD
MYTDNNNHYSDFENIPAIKDYCNSLRLDKSACTIRSYISSIDKFLAYCHNLEIVTDYQNITISTCREYELQLKNEGLQYSSINALLRPLKVVYNFLLENGYVNENPFVKLKFMKEPKKSKSFLSNEEIDSMFSACKNLEEKTLFAVMISLGLRRSELVNLKVEDIAENKVKIFGKGSKERVLFLPDDVKDMVNEYISSKKHGNSEYLFPSSWGGSYSTESIRLKIKRIAEHAGIDEKRLEDITPHCLRRTFATNLVENDVNLAVIQNAMGHSAVSTTMLYAKIRESAVENAMKNQRSFKS